MKKVPKGTERDVPGTKPDCPHWVQYTETDKNGSVWQVCKRCSRKLFVREESNGKKLV